jgi:hypothetical protein
VQCTAGFGKIELMFFLYVSVNVNASDTVREGYKKHSWSGTNTNGFAGLMLFAGIPGYCPTATGVNQCVLMEAAAPTSWRQQHPPAGGNSTHQLEAAAPTSWRQQHPPAAPFLHVCHKHSYLSENKCKNYECLVCFWYWMSHAAVLSGLVSNSTGPELKSRTEHQKRFEAVRTSAHFCQTSGGMALSNL